MGKCTAYTCIFLIGDYALYEEDESPGHLVYLPNDGDNFHPGDGAEDGYELENLSGDAQDMIMAEYRKISEEELRGWHLICFPDDVLTGPVRCTWSKEKGFFWIDKNKQ